MNFSGPAYRYTPEEMARKVYGSAKAPERLPATSSRWQDQEEYKGQSGVSDRFAPLVVSGAGNPYRRALDRAYGSCEGGQGESKA